MRGGEGGRGRECEGGMDEKEWGGGGGRWRGGRQGIALSDLTSDYFVAQLPQVKVEMRQGKEMRNFRGSGAMRHAKRQYNKLLHNTYCT